MPRSTPLQPRRFFVYDSPRTCSQLFNKLFAAHPQLEQVFHPLAFWTAYGPERLALRLKHCDAAERKQLELAETANMTEETAEVAARRLKEGIENAEKKGKIAFVKDHCICYLRPEIVDTALQCGLGGGHQLPFEALPDNPTILEDELFESATPIIVIRHPALMIPSYFARARVVFHQEATDEDFRVITSLRWAKLLFDAHSCLYEKEQGSTDKHADNQDFSFQEPNIVVRKPIVVDAEDIVYHTRALMSQLCSRLDIDADQIQYTWDPVPKSQWPADPISLAFFQEILSSRGVEQREAKPQDQNIDLEAKMAQWIETYGEDTARSLRAHVDDEMTNYEYLRQFRLDAHGFN